MNDIKAEEIIQYADSCGLSWDFYEDSPESMIDCLHTIPGTVVRWLSNGGCDDEVIGRLATFVATRSLPCWFIYCDTPQPLDTCVKVLDYWDCQLPHRCDVESHLFVPPTPSFQGTEIIDCRYTDTHSVSSSAANAAQFTKTRNDFHAITAMSHAYIAYNHTPLGDRDSVDAFVEWFSRIAIPSAIDKRRLTVIDLLANLAFPLPVDLERQL